MIGHLHLLWYWALDHSDGGDLSKFDADDLADAACWEGDPAEFVAALVECGPKDTEGFLNVDWSLHDWDEYGGKYGKRVEAGRKAAAARWHTEPDADPMRSHSNGNANPMPTHSDANTEERRGEKKETVGARKRATQLPDGWEPNGTHHKIAEETGVDLKLEAVQFRDHHAAKGSTYKDWDAAFRTWLRNAVKFGNGGKSPAGQTRRDVDALLGMRAYSNTGAA
jgi:hypothetical protein